MSNDKINISGVSENLSESISHDIESETKNDKLRLLDKRIAISVSDSEECEELGFSSVHQKDITTELTRFLLANGAHLVYGGDLRKDGYTHMFEEMAFQYRSKEESDKFHYTNFFGWPIHLNLHNPMKAVFKKNRVKVKIVACPEEIPSDLQSVFIAADTVDNKYYWARSMTKMRDEMSLFSQARVAIGGMTAGYKGFYPGIIEEVHFAIKAKQPTYLLGAFGGATSYAIRALKGEDPQKLSSELFTLYPQLRELHSFAEQKTGSIQSFESLLEDLWNVGLKGLSKLNNLSIEQNEILFETKHFHEMVFYVLLGLRKALV